MIENKFIDELLKLTNSKNDAKLAYKLNVAPCVLSKIRHGKKVGATILISAHEESGLSIRELKELAGV